MNEYLEFDSSITLGDAIRKMRAAEPEDMANQVPAEIVPALEQHDAVHILFNLGTSIQDEIAAHVWMVCATTANIGEMHRVVATREHRSVLSGIGHLKSIGIWLSSLPRIISILFKSLRMNQKVDVQDFSRLKEQSVLEIRQKYGILL